MSPFTRSDWSDSLSSSLTIDDDFLDVFFEALQGVGQGRFRQAKVVADLVHLGDNFVGIFPTSVSTIELGWDQDAVEEFTVEFQVDYWEVSGGSTGNAGGI